MIAVKLGCEMPVRVPVRFSSGSPLFQSESTDSANLGMGRGIGSFWLEAQIEVVKDEEGKQTVVASMQVPEVYQSMAPEKLIERFINGFGGPKE